MRPLALSNRPSLEDSTVVLDQGAGLIAIEARHHDVDKNDSRVMIGNLGQGLETVNRRDDFTAHVLEQRFSCAANRLRVIDHHHLQGAGMLFHILFYHRHSESI